MSEHKQRSLKKAEILKAAVRCVYCKNTEALTVEHMPPRGLFKDKDRPSGWEFACCNRCNEGTRGADAVAQFVSKIEAISENSWKQESLLKLKSALQIHAPSVFHEILKADTWTDALVNRRGLLHPVKSVRLNGPETKRYLDIFAAKIAMAAFHTYTKRPLNMDSIIYTQWYLNGGIQQKEYDHVVSIMPHYAELKQGIKSSGRQFSLKYNTNNNDIVAAMFSFHESLHITIIATDSPELRDPLKDLFLSIPHFEGSTINLTKAGLHEIDTNNKTICAQ